MSEWEVIHINERYRCDFCATNREKSFETNDQDDAEWLCETLNGLENKPTEQKYE